MLNRIFSLSQTQFVVDEVSNIIKESIESTIGGNSYTHSKVNNWTNSVVESCLASLTKLQKPFKYIGECRIFLVTSFLKSKINFFSKREKSCTVHENTHV